MNIRFSLRAALATLVLSAATALAPVHAAPPAAEGGFAFSTDPAVGAQQHAAYDVVHRYEELLNAGDTAGILKLFAPDSVAEWNDRTTFRTEEEKADAYNALFKVAKFATVFGYADIVALGDTAVVRTYHHEGATVLENGKKVVDLNREVFVLHRINGELRIVLYIFNTDPVQGEG